jgi:uncharacterized membrane protein (DUF4010 family)
VVLVFSAVNFAAYVALRTLGARRGYGTSGLLGGLISSTAVTLQFARRSHHSRAMGGALALGVLAACVVLVLRLEVLTAILNPPLALRLAHYLWPVLLCGLIMLAVLYRRNPDPGSGEEEHLGNPLAFRSSVLMAIGFQVAVLVMGVAESWLGSAGVVVSAAVLGLTDMDALTYAMSRLGSTGELVDLAAKSIAIGMIANTVLKGLIALVIGRGHFRREVLAGLGLLLGGALAGLWLAEMSRGL